VNHSLLVRVVNGVRQVGDEVGYFVSATFAKTSPTIEIEPVDKLTD
jgi:hypothetical protein